MKFGDRKSCFLWANAAFTVTAILVMYFYRSDGLHFEWSFTVVSIYGLIALFLCLFHAEVYLYV
jgi:hypothetical protein